MDPQQSPRTPILPCGTSNTKGQAAVKLLCVVLLGEWEVGFEADYEGGAHS